MYGGRSLTWVVFRVTVEEDSWLAGEVAKLQIVGDAPELGAYHLKGAADLVHVKGGAQCPPSPPPPRLPGPPPPAAGADACPPPALPASPQGATCGSRSR